MLIGDVARYTGVSVRMLRHYDAVGLVRPTGRTIGGYRDYSDDDVRTILQVKTLRSLGLTLKQIGRILEDPGRAPAPGRRPRSSDGGTPGSGTRTARPAPGDCGIQAR